MDKIYTCVGNTTPKGTKVLKMGGVTTRKELGNQMSQAFKMLQHNALRLKELNAELIEHNLKYDERMCVFHEYVNGESYRNHKCNDGCVYLNVEQELN